MSYGFKCYKANTVQKMTFNDLFFINFNNAVML